MVEPDNLLGPSLLVGRAAPAQLRPQAVVQLAGGLTLTAVSGFNQKRV